MPPYDPTFDTTPFWRQLIGGVPADIYLGMKFTGNTATTTDPVHPAKMFRSSIRDTRQSGTAHFDPSQQLLLRAAIAAANTIQLRALDKTTYRTVRIPVSWSSNGARRLCRSGTKDRARMRP